MKRIIALPFAALSLALSLAACGDRQPDADTAGDTMAEPVPATDPTMADASGQAPADATAAATPDGSMAGDAGAAPAERNALGVLNAINEHEIAAGQQALKKGVKGDVAEYAQMMIDQHTENREKTTSLNPDPAAADAQAQQQKGQAELAALEATSGEAYSRAYIDAMVKGHTEALAALDGKLIPAASSPAVREHLTQTRGHVAEHLERAKALATSAK